MSGKAPSADGSPRSPWANGPPGHPLPPPTPPPERIGAVMASSVPIRYRQAIRNSPASPWSVSRAHQKHCPLRTPSADGSPRGRGTADRAALHLGALVHARTASGAVMASSVPIRYSQIRNGPASPWSISDRPHRRMCASSRLAGPIPVRRLKNCVNRSSSSAPEGLPSA